MSRVPPGHGGNAQLPGMYYSGVHPSQVVPGQGSVGMSGGYGVDPVYGSYARPPPNAGQVHQQQGGPYAPDGYNAVAGPSRDPYVSYGAQPRAVSGGMGGWDGVDTKPGKMDDGRSGASAQMSMQYDGSKLASGAAASGAENAGSGAQGSGQQPGPSEFIKKLYKMLEDESATYGRGKPAGAPRSKGERGSVGWGRGGTSFVVWDMNEFTTKILPQTFRHSNFSSFVRQLNKYGFSKIKHVDEDTGQIKENVWEFQHPNFQAGGKADLDSIKRKAVVPKKGAAEDREASPARGLSGEDVNRIMDMESRMAGLEDILYKTQEQLRDSRNREAGMMSLMRDVVGHLAASQKEMPTADGESKARVHHLLQLFDQVIQTGAAPPPPHAAFVGGGAVPGGFPPSYGGAPPIAYGSMPFPAGRYGVPLQPGAPGAPTGQHVSPRPEGSRDASDGPSPSARAQGQAAVHHRDAGGDDVIEIPSQHQGMFMPPGGMSDSGQWMTDGTSNGSMYAKPESTTLRFTAFAPSQLQQQAGGATVAPVDERDPLDTTSAEGSASVGASGANTAAATAGGGGVEPSPFGTLSVPAQPAAGGRQASRRGTTIKPSWTQAPRILVVEDDVVYRQLSSKFLEKFGCIVETVENAQQGIEKMNNTKYDLVLMDIFFGPSMDGRKATSLIRQFDVLTPIISMTSNVQTKDVETYIQSGMNDVLAKPFTKHGLFGILDKHLIHLKAIQLSGEVPRFLGVPPLSDQGVVDALTTTAAQWDGEADTFSNPLAGSGWADDAYQIVLQQFMATGAVPDSTTVSNGLTNGMSNGLGAMGAGQAFGTSVVFPNSMFTGNRKRSIEAVNEDDWEEQAKKRMAPSGTVSEMS